MTLIDLAHAILWHPLVLWGMLWFGIYFVITLRCLPLRPSMIARAIRSLFQPSSSASSLSTFQIVATNLGAVMGIGNMVGVASAILVGGAGALFWMWLSSVLVSTIKYAEILLALGYRKRVGHGYVGGPMYYIKEGVGSPWLAAMYTIALLLSSFGIGNMVASNSITSILEESLHLPALFWGVVLTLVMTVVLLGGLKRVVAISEVLVPFLVVLYCGACLYIVWIERSSFGTMLQYVIASAFDFQAISGAGMGLAMKYGMSRGIYSNEAGMGSATLTHVQSETSNMVEQSIWGVVEVFLDTIVMCSISGFVILLSQAPMSITNPVMLMSAVFQSYFPRFGLGFVALSIVLFGFASMIGWYFYGIQCVTYLTKKSFGQHLYRLLFLGSLLLGAVYQADVLWMLSDTFNGIVLWINLFALFVLRKEVIHLTKAYQEARRASS